MIETGLSDFHKMTVTVMKTTSEKLKPNIIHYRDYRKFSNDKFRENLISCLSTENIRIDCNGMEKFLQICIKALDEVAPQKKKYSRRNNMPFVNKSIKKVFMKRSLLKNTYLKIRSDNSKREYNKQRNYDVSILRKTKTNYYANLNEKDLTDNKQFWRTVKPLLSDKIKTPEKIALVQQRETLDTDGNIDDEIVNDDVKIAEIFNRFFSNAAIVLKSPDFHVAVPLADNISHPSFRAILKYADHPNTIAIKDLNNTSLFSFSNISVDDDKKEIRKLDPRKATQNTDIPVIILKQNSDIVGNYICDFFNECVDKAVFPSILKKANITPVFKKGFRGSKDNYRPVSILPIISKIFEKLIEKQIVIYMDKFLSKYQCGFRKGHDAQHSLLAMIEKWKKAVDNGNVFGALLTDLSKAFDCLPHDLIIAKLNSYGINLTALTLIHNYLTKRNQRTILKLFV